MIVEEAEDQAARAAAKLHGGQVVAWYPWPMDPISRDVFIARHVFQLVVSQRTDVRGFSAVSSELLRCVLLIYYVHFCCCDVDAISWQVLWILLLG